MVLIAGIAKERLAPAGYVQIHGELWRAEIIDDGPPVEMGQPVCTIEAMKMKNTIRADRSGIVTSVPISLGQSVKHKQVLVEFTE